MLRLYRRHRASCPHRGQRYRNCKAKCPIYVVGTLRGERIKKSLDLVDWQEPVFRSIVGEVRQFIAALQDPVPVTAIPMSALLGDNVVDGSQFTPWYDGPPLLTFLEDFETRPHTDLGARAADQGIDDWCGKLRFAEYAGRLCRPNPFAQFSNALGARRLVGRDGERAYDFRAEMVLEILVGIMEDDVRPVLDRTQPRFDSVFEVSNAAMHFCGVLGVTRTICSIESTEFRRDV